MHYAYALENDDNAGFTSGIENSLIDPPAWAVSGDQIK